jgi:NAD(P)H-dependent flavin oxidoreductase YrpB (nitropropane dioxygenase family)
MLHTPLCAQIGMAYPLFSVGMGPVAGPALAAAVSNAGGCGVLGGVLLPPPNLRQAIHQLRTLTDKPFGVNLIVPLLQAEQVEVCLARIVKIFELTFLLEVTPPPIAALHLVFRPPVTDTHRQ